MAPRPVLRRRPLLAGLLACGLSPARAETQRFRITLANLDQQIDVRGDRCLGVGDGTRGVAGIVEIYHVDWQATRRQFGMESLKACTSRCPR